MKDKKKFPPKQNNITKLKLYLKKIENAERHRMGSSDK